jgi:DinB family protein
MMDAKQAQHLDRVRHLRESFVEANERLVARLRRVDDEAAERVPEKGWSAAQIGWHVAAVDAQFAGLMSGELAAAQPLADGVSERPWGEIVAGIPSKLEAGRRVQPPAGVRRDDILAALADAGAKLDAALAALDPDRGATYAITHPVIGTVTLRQIGDWATAHTIRHNAQAKRVLGLLTRAAP